MGLDSTDSAAVRKREQPRVQSACVVRHGLHAAVRVTERVPRPIGKVRMEERVEVCTWVPVSWPWHKEQTPRMRVSRVRACML